MTSVEAEFKGTDAADQPFCVPAPFHEDESSPPLSPTQKQQQEQQPSSQEDAQRASFSTDDTRLSGGYENEMDFADIVNRGG